MKYLVLLNIILLLASCVPSKTEESVLQFQVNRTPSSISNLEQSGLNIRQIDRYYVTSILTDVFGPSAAPSIANYIKKKMDTFGGGCDQYDRSNDTAGKCLNDDCDLIMCSGNNIIHNQIGVSSVIRQGWTIKACEEISGKDAAILFALQYIIEDKTLTKANVPVPNNETLIKAYGKFYRSTAPNQEIITSLSNIALAETTNNFEKWRYVLLAVCTTPEWQIP